MKKHHIILIIGTAILLIDLIYTFYQMLHAPLDGDLAAIALPNEWYAQVLKDPFGFAVLTEQVHYASTNRYFSHALLHYWFCHVPLFLQRFLSPLDSVYCSAAILKMITHIALLGISYQLFTRFFAENDKKQGLWFLLLLFPLFQTYGFNGSIGLVDVSVTYCCFYALPFYLLLMRGVFLIPALFSSPINALVMLLSLALYRLRFQNRLIKWEIFAAVLSLYAIYIGFFNKENAPASLTLWQRYCLVPKGLFEMFFIKIGPALLLLFVIFNSFFLQKITAKQAQTIRQFGLFLLIFALIYIIFLPLAGYRAYRPNIIRRDLMLPVLWGMIFYWAASSWCILQNLFAQKRLLYAAFVAVFLVIMQFSDKPDFEKYHCERAALETLAKSKTPTVILNNDCPVMTWLPIDNFESSRDNVKILRHWRVLEEEVLYQNAKLKEKI